MSALLKDGETFEMKGSGAKPYVLKNTGRVFSCTCPAWRNQSTPIERRTCKHLKKLRGEANETARCAGIDPGMGYEEGQVNMSDSLIEIPKVVPPLLLAHSWDNEQDLTGWWMSEKLDGVRAYWNGKDFISRLGNVYHAPDWFKEGLPEHCVLDGELWLGRKRFQECVSIVRRQDKNEDWKKISFLVFDAPSNFQFEFRQALVKDYANRASYAAPVSQSKCLGIRHLREALKAVEAQGGEGLMLREPRSRYEVGRSHTLLKVKSFHDAEAKVLGHEPGKGKHKGRLGALRVALYDGTEFSVGTGFSDAERSNPPPIGCVITFRYQELSTGGVPRFPVFVSVRYDVEAW